MRWPTYVRKQQRKSFCLFVLSERFHDDFGLTSILGHSKNKNVSDKKALVYLSIVPRALKTSISIIIVFKYYSNTILISYSNTCRSSSSGSTFIFLQVSFWVGIYRNPQVKNLCRKKKTVPPLSTVAWVKRGRQRHIYGMIVTPPQQFMRGYGDTVCDSNS